MSDSAVETIAFFAFLFLIAALGAGADIIKAWKGGKSLSVLLHRCGVQPRKVPLTSGQNIAKQIAWKFCVVVFWVAVVILFIAEAFLF